MAHKRRRQKAWKVLTAYCPSCMTRLPGTNTGGRPEYPAHCPACGWRENAEIDHASVSDEAAEYLNWYEERAVS